MVSTKPTAIWFRRSSMLAKAISSATAIETTAATRKPSSTLPVA